jgi:hypothetical protein
MSCAAIDVKPQDVDDWAALFQDEGRATFLEAVECHACGKVTVRAPFESECPKCKAEGDGPEGPMMNYFYPLGFEVDDGTARKHAWRIRNLPLCMVRVGDVWGMALTGGGMNLSWEICEAFMRLGCLPPAHFTPAAMCGRGTSAKDRWIVRGYVRSCRVLVGWTKRRAQEAREALAFGEKYEADRATRDETNRAELESEDRP